jgi:integrase
MASTRIRKRSDGTLYTAVLYRDNGKQASRSFDDHAEALQLAALINKYGVHDGLRIHGIQHDAAKHDPHALTVEQFLTAHIDTLTGVEAATRTQYRRYVHRDIRGTIGDLPLATLDRATLADWLNKQTGSAKTIRNKLVFLAGALNAAVDADLIAANPTRGLRPPAGLRREPVFLTPAEFRAIHSHIPPHWQPLTLWLATPGTRFGEATALRVGDVDPTAGTARIARAWKNAATEAEAHIGATKTKAGTRTINVPRNTVNTLDLDRPPSALLFVNPAGVRVTRHDYYNNAWKGARVRAGMGEGDRVPRVHDLRHTNASWLLNGGTPMTAVSRHLGHASIKVTVDVYHHLDRDVAELAAQALDRLLAPGD